MRLTGWTKLGWNYFIVTYHRIQKNICHLSLFKNIWENILNNFEDPLLIPQPTIGLNNT